MKQSIVEGNAELQKEEIEALIPWDPDNLCP